MHQSRRWVRPTSPANTKSILGGASVPSRTARRAFASPCSTTTAPLRVAVDHHAVVRVPRRRHRRLEIGGPGLDRLIAGEVEQPRQFPQRLVWPRRATRSPEPWISERELEYAQSPGEGPSLVGRSHRDWLVEVLARMGGLDELVHDDLAVGGVKLRARRPAHDQGGGVGRRSRPSRADAVGAAVAIPTPSATASAPMRPMCFAVLIIRPRFRSGENDGPPRPVSAQ